MTNTEPTGLGPRTRRAAIIVFLAVFLGGMGLSSASALWSQQSTAAATITTGHWKTTTPGWGVPLTVSLVETGYNLGTLVHTVRVSWVPQNADDAKVPGLSYTLAVTKSSGLGTVTHTMNPDGRSATIVVDRVFLSAATVDVRITPVVGGVPGAPVTKSFRAELVGGIREL